MAIGRKMDEAWKRAISEGLKKANSGMSAAEKMAGKGMVKAGETMVRAGYRRMPGAAGFLGGGVAGAGGVLSLRAAVGGAYKVSRALSGVGPSAGTVSKLMRSPAAGVIRKTGLKVNPGTIGTAVRTGAGIASGGTALLIGYAAGVVGGKAAKATMMATRTKSEKKLIRGGEKMAAIGRKLSKG